MSLLTDRKKAAAQEDENLMLPLSNYGKRSRICWLKRPTAQA